MGEVWAGEPLGPGGAVAIKVVQTDQNTNPHVVARFKSEALAAARLEHPNTVKVLDFGDTEEGMLFLVMEFLRGQNLDALLKRTGRLSEQRALSIAVQMLDALVAAHQNNIIHRDLKPANVMLVKGAEGRETVKVLDFGIAKLIDPLTSEDPTGMMTLTRAGTVVGTPAYMSPEQAAGQRVDPRADLYSTGVTLYHMVTGEKPFRANTLVGLLQQVIAAEPPRVSSRLSTVDPRLEWIIHTAMQKDPHRRFASARDMRDAIQQVVEAGERRLHTTAALAAGGPTESAATMVMPNSGPVTGANAPMLAPTSDATNLRSDTLVSPNANPALLPASSPVARPAAMQSMGGYTLPYGTGTFESPPTERSTSQLLFGALALIVAVLVGAFIMHQVLTPRPSLDELTRRLDRKAWGAAETYALDHYELFSSDPVAYAAVRQSMAMRRENFAEVWVEHGMAHDPEGMITPGEWRGQARFPDRPERYRFSYVLERVDETTVEGYCDWPEIGIRVRIVGYRDGNHLLMWDEEFLMKSRTSLPYNLYDKKSVLISGDRFVGFDGPYRAILDGRRVDM